MVLTPDKPPATRSGADSRRSLARLVWEELLVPVGVVAGLLFIAVALIEGSPLQQFLYAVF